MVAHGDWPVDPGIIGPFLIAVLLVELTPGPNMGYLAALSAGQGRRDGFAAVAGVTAGLTAYMLAAAFGLTEIFLVSRPLYEALRWAGVAFLLWLAWDAWNGASDVGTVDQNRQSRWRLFLRGFVANILNPKAAIFYITLLPSFIQVDHAAPRTQALIFGSLHVAVSALVHCSIVLGAASAANVLAKAGRGGDLSGLRKAMGVVIALIAVWLAWETRR
ncbi:LysE family translocator [Caulobacter sp. NIBR2454]|uniref:LysE family translocator n=1 Tax=Caulobacter sp. NIBR2454 TaxID=3015996 RepID=UPI0022B67824|nr:LysE family translocator [Caulobacter sp. NIBR2454]